MKLRKHQEAARKEAQTVMALGGRKVTVANVTPGGGKTLLASVFANEMLDAGFVEQVIIICPRDSLRSQMQDGFACAEASLLRKVVVWDPDKNMQRTLLRDICGVVTTYQLAFARAAKLKRLVENRRTLLILDEVHHLAGSDEDDDDENYLAWRACVDPLVTAARHVLAMTGTIYRSDNARIPYVEYSGEERPIAQIRYTRQDALDEGAVLPIEFRMWDGAAKFSFRGEEHSTDLSEAIGDDAKRALRTALLDMRDDDEKGYVSQFVENALGEWAHYRMQVYRSKAIVVCNTQAQARWMAEKVKRLGFEPELAISDEKDSARRIRRFRMGTGGDVLVTVGMAYEGLDVPDATHMLLLTSRRARPWLEQAVARVTRINRRATTVKAEDQLAYVYISDDKRARAFVDDIMSEQAQSVPLQERTKGQSLARGRSSFVPMHCEATHRSEGSDVGGRLTKAQSAEIEDLRACTPEFAHLPAREVLRRSEILRRKYGASL